MTFAEECAREADAFDNGVAVVEREESARAAKDQRGAERTAADAGDADVRERSFQISWQGRVCGKRLRQFGVLEQRRETRAGCGPSRERRELTISIRGSQIS